MYFKEIENLIGVREDVDNVLLDLNTYLADAVGQTFVIGVGPDGPTATWSRKSGGSNFSLIVLMSEVAAILRRKLDISAHVVL